MPQVTIMRGIPGCGKSTYAKNIPDAIVVSADDFHIVDGVYVYKQENAANVHNQCLDYYVRTLVMLPRARQVVVDNTNVKLFEIAPYYRLAEAMGFSVEIVQFLCDPQLGFDRTIHKVPMSTISAMARGFEPLPPWWNVRYVVSIPQERAACHS